MQRTLSLIWKYKAHYLIAIPAILLVLLLKLIPMIFSVVISLEDFKPVKGIFGSEWVGLANFERLIADPAFHIVLGNTLIIKIEYILFSGLVAYVLGLSISCIRSGRLRNAVAGICLAPYFIPSAILAYTVTRLLPVTNDQLFRAILVMTETFKTVGLPLLLVLAAIGCARMRQDERNAGAGFAQERMLPAARAIAAFMIVQLSTLLTTDFELVRGMLSRSTQKVGETLDSFHFIAAFVRMNYSFGDVIWLFQFVVQLLLTLVGYVVVRRWLVSDLFHRPVNEPIEPPVQGTREGIVSAVGVLYAVFVLGALFILLIYPLFSNPFIWVSFPEIWSGSNLIPYIFVYGMTGVVSMLVMLTLAYPLTVRNLPGRRVYKLILLAAAIAGACSIQNFFLVQSLGLLHTFFASAVTGMLPLVGVFVLKSIFITKHLGRKEKAEQQGHGELHTFFTVYIPSIWKPLLALGVLQFVSLWNSYISSLFYTNDISTVSPMMHFTNMLHYVTASGELEMEQALLQYGAVLCLPPLILYILFHRWLTSEVLLSQSRML